MVIVPVTSKDSLDNKTGSWRDFRPIVTERCTGCGICPRFCPDGCIEMVDREKIILPKKKISIKKPQPYTKIAKIDYDYCKGCLICKTECPFKAIDSLRENENDTKK